MKNNIKKRIDNFLLLNKQKSFKKNLIISSEFFNLYDFNKYKKISYKELYNIIEKEQIKNSFIIVTDIDTNYFVSLKKINNLIKFNYLNNQYLNNSYILIIDYKINVFKENAILLM